jgi:GDPmannose 4,6-dehydratase
MWLMLQQDTPKDYVVASGVNHSVREFVDYAFDCAGLNYQEFVEVDQRFYREAEKIPLCGSISNIQTELNWRSDRQLKDIIGEMVEYDLRVFSQDNLTNMTFTMPQNEQELARNLKIKA